MWGFAAVDDFVESARNKKKPFILYRFLVFVFPLFLRIIKRKREGFFIVFVASRWTGRDLDRVLVFYWRQLFLNLQDWRREIKKREKREAPSDDKWSLRLKIEVRSVLKVYEKW